VSAWYIEPRDPLLVRDGRPNSGRSASATLPFPYPGSLAGVVRTRLGSDPSGVFVFGEQLNDLRRVGVRGPLLASPSTRELFAPAPRDALVLRTPDGLAALRALRPISVPPGVLTDTISTSLVGLAPGDVVEGKPPRGVPAFWPWDAFARWLVSPGAFNGDEAEAFTSRGIPRLPMEARVHVKLDDYATADEGMLFQTAGVRFHAAHGSKPLALTFDVEASVLGPTTVLREGIGPYGGERRLVRWSSAKDPIWPEIPAEIRACLAQPVASVRVRVVLVTPGIFVEGWRPGTEQGQLLAPWHDVRVSLVAACVPRPETISGWDFA
jgi:CRISPR-associated protein Cmr3